MSSELYSTQREFVDAFLEALAEISPIPIGLYRRQAGKTQEVIPEAARGKYEEHCKLIQNYPGGKRLCEADQLARAEAALDTGQSLSQTCCWAGVLNESKLITIEGQTKALLVYGGGKIGTPSKRKESLRKHMHAAKTLGLTGPEAADLQSQLESIQQCSQPDLDKLDRIISNFERLLRVLEEKSNERKYVAERSLHDIVTRLQAVVAEADNIVTQIDDRDYELAAATAQAVLNSALSLDTVAQSFGNYLEAYQFKRVSLKHLVERSVKLYEAEANRKNVGIVQRLQHPSDIWVSPNHLQYALNNLIHNAIKYSFRGQPIVGRRRASRYVDIEGKAERGAYRLSVTNYGVGILPEEYESIFEDGYKGHLTENEYRTGSGKGLAFVKRIVDEHHGTIEVESEYFSFGAREEGEPHLTTFTIRLPYSARS